MTEDIASTAELLATMRDTSQRTHQLTKAIDRVIATNRLNPDFDWLLSRLQNLVVASHSSSSGSAGVDPDSPMKRTSVNITEYASKVGLFSSGHLSDSYSAHAQFTQPLYRKAASRFHPDHSKDPEAHEKFQLAKMLSDANDAEGLALLLFQDGMAAQDIESSFDYRKLLMERIGAQQRHQQSLESSLGYKILQLEITGRLTPDGAASVVRYWLKRLHDAHLEKDFDGWKREQGI